ncbi:MAG: DUF4349 domain-containing protein [Pyrinomonadaceae bacterium]
MKLIKFFIFLVLLCFFSSCSRLERTDSLRSGAGAPEQYAEKQLAKDQSGPNQQVSLKQAGDSQSMAEAMNRKIIRNAELTLEVTAPQDVQRRISSIAESLGGFVVTSEAKQRQNAEGAKQEIEVSLVIRVPAAQFAVALDQVRGAGNRVVQEKITGEDVTEEFIDLEARIKTQKALEEQFLEIMKRANKVEDALEVQRQIAEVRTEIEKLEGRKRFLENRASLSTITVSLQTPTAIAVNTSGFGRDIREAVADSVQVAIAIVLFLIRFVILMIPIFLLIILPVWLLGRYFLRRARKSQRSREGNPNSQPGALSDKPIDSQPN